MAGELNYPEYYIEPPAPVEPPAQTGIQDPTQVRFDSETLEYLLLTVRDDTLQQDLQWLANAKLKKKTKRNFMLLMYNFFSTEYVVTNYVMYDELRKRWLEFRATLNHTQNQISRIENKYCDTQMFIKQLESHFRNKITRALRGFERETQNTTFFKTDQTATNRHELPEAKTGISRA